MNGSPKITYPDLDNFNLNKQLYVRLVELLQSSSRCS